jgi:hypothetical protein
VCVRAGAVFHDVINLDKYNLFLLGICFMSQEALFWRLLALHGIAFHITMCIMAAIKDIPVRRPKKTPDKKERECITAATPCGLIACSSTLLHNLVDVTGIYSESFDVEEQVIVGLDSMCSHHLFIDKSAFVSDIKPITPFDIQGVGGNIRAIGQGTVRLRFCCSNGSSHDKLLPNAYFAPNAPVHLISIHQLGRDSAESSTLCTGGVNQF